MSVTPLEHPFLAGLFGDAEISKLFSASADIDAMLSFEAALAEAEAMAGIITHDEANAVLSAISSWSVDMAALRHGVGRDGVVIPELIRQLRQAAGGAVAGKVHFGATSQDVIDTSLMLRLKQATAVLIMRLGHIIDALEALASRDGGNRLTGYTRMQAAIPISATARVESWRQPLKRHLMRLETFNENGFPVQFGGAAGTLEKLDADADAVRAALARRLGLADKPQWQSQRDGIAEFCNLLSLVTGTLGKFGQDVALLARSGGEIRLSGSGGSSAMPHKHNPVLAETLVALGRFNAIQLCAIHQSLVHEHERSGSAWMLEWLTLPQMVTATGTALILGNRLAGQIELLGVREE